MTSRNIFLTKSGLLQLQKEYEELLTKKRPNVIKRLAKARENGDLSENAEWDAACEEQGFVEGRILELSEIIKKAKLIAEDKESIMVRGGVIGIGSTVKVQTDNGVDQFMIVGSFEADPVKKKISDESPVGKALLGVKKGETVQINTPVLQMSYKVLDVS